MSKNVPIKSNLLQQNCFLRDCSPALDISGKNSLSDGVSYESVDLVTESDGIRVRKTLVPYPITPDYVDSFVDSSDYRKDPAAAVLNSVKKPNLGDITSFQDVSSMDTASAQALYKQLQARFSSVSVAAPVASSDYNGGDNDGK